MGWPSYRENILEKITEALEQVNKDLNRETDGNSLKRDTESQRFEESILRLQVRIGEILDSYLDLVTDPSINLAKMYQDLHASIEAKEYRIVELEKDLVKTKALLVERQNEINSLNLTNSELLEENKKLLMKSEFLSIGASKTAKDKLKRK